MNTNGTGQIPFTKRGVHYGEVFNNRGFTVILPFLRTFSAETDNARECVTNICPGGFSRYLVQSTVVSRVRMCEGDEFSDGGSETFFAR